MRNKVKATSPEAELTRILEALEQEIIDASDEDVIGAAADLGMDPSMRGSAAFAGLKFPAKPQLSDFFEFAICENAQVAAPPIPDATRSEPKRKARQLGRFETWREGKGSRGK
jgi:hypothetical protein